MSLPAEPIHCAGTLKKKKEPDKLLKKGQSTPVLPPDCSVLPAHTMLVLKTLITHLTKMAELL